MSLENEKIEVREEVNTDDSELNPALTSSLMYQELIKKFGLEDGDPDGKITEELYSA